MKVDIVSALFGKPGGAENATRTLAETLLKQGVDVRVVGTREEARAFAYAYVLPGTERIPALLLTYGWNPIFDGIYERHLSRYFDERRPDVVLLEDHMLFVGAVRAVRRYNARGGNAKLVMSQIWDVDPRFFYEFRRYPFSWWFAQHFWRLNAMSREMDLVNAFVPFHKSQLVKLFGTDPGKIVTVQTTSIEPVTIPRPAVLSKPLVFAAPGRLCPEKGCFFLLDAADALRKRTNDFAIELYGTGPSEAKLRRDVERRGLSGFVRVKGAVSRDVLWSAISGAAATCVPIMYPPGLTCTALESLSAGVPIVAFDHGATPDMIDNGVTGFRTAPRDVEAYAAAMYEFVKDPALSLRMEQACREKCAELASPDAGASELYRTFVERFGNQAEALHAVH